MSKKLLKMAIEIVDLPIKKWWICPSFLVCVTRGDDGFHGHFHGDLRISYDLMTFRTVFHGIQKGMNENVIGILLGFES